VAKAALEQEHSPAAMSDQKITMIKLQWWNNKMISASRIQKIISIKNNH